MDAKWWSEDGIHYLELPDAMLKVWRNGSHWEVEAFIILGTTTVDIMRLCWETEGLSYQAARREARRWLRETLDKLAGAREEICFGTAEEGE